MMSAASSGGVSCRTLLAALMMASSSCCSASVTSSLLTKMVRGRPDTRSRPLTSMESLSSRYKADPIVILISSAVRSPIARLYFLLICSMIAVSNLFPPTRTEVDVTIPPSEMTAISDVPPPISMIMWPDADPIGMSAPIAAATGSLIIYAAFAPAATLASITARRSVEEMPAGTATMTSGLKRRTPPVALLIKYLSIASVIL